MLKIAKVLGRGGSHMTSTICKDFIINTDEVARINNFVIPVCLDTFYLLITKGI